MTLFQLQRHLRLSDAIRIRLLRTAAAKVLLLLEDAATVVVEGDEVVTNEVVTEEVHEAVEEAGNEVEAGAMSGLGAAEATTRKVA